MGLLVDAYILTRELVGASGAGKTTITTQLWIAQEGEGRFDEEERAARRAVIFGHVVRAARLVVNVM